LLGKNSGSNAAGRQNVIWDSFAFILYTICANHPYVNVQIPTALLQRFQTAK